MTTLPPPHVSVPVCLADEDGWRVGIESPLAFVAGVGLRASECSQLLPSPSPPPSAPHRLSHTTPTQHTHPLTHPQPSPHPTQLSISPLNGKMVLGDAGMTKTLVTVSNLSSNPGGVAFKVKTTKPRRYLVRPNQGILGPGERKEVAILMSSEKQAEARNELEERAVSDKFQVVYLSLSEVAYESLKNAAEGKEQVYENRMRWIVRYLWDFYLHPTKLTYVLSPSSNPARKQVESLERLWEQADKRAVCNKKFDVELVLSEGTAAQALRNTLSNSSSSEKNGKSAPPPSSVGELQKPESVAPSAFGSNEVGFAHLSLLSLKIRNTYSLHSLFAVPSLADDRLSAAVR